VTTRPKAGAQRAREQYTNHRTCVNLRVLCTDNRSSATTLASNQGQIQTLRYPNRNQNQAQPRLLKSCPFPTHIYAVRVDFQWRIMTKHASNSPTPISIHNAYTHKNGVRMRDHVIPTSASRWRHMDGLTSGCQQMHMEFVDWANSVVILLYWYIPIFYCSILLFSK